MTRIVSKPGPPRTSCFTCRQRRKKCDTSKPRCGSCLRRGYECEYEDDKLRWGPRRRDSRKPIHSRSQPPSTAQIRTIRTEALGSAAFPASEGPPASITTSAGRSSGTSILGAALLYQMNKPISSTNDDSVTIASNFSGFDCSWPQHTITMSGYSPKSTRNPSCATGVISNSTSRSIEDTCRSIPASVDSTRMMKESQLARVINEYRTQRVDYWFNPSPPTRNSILTQVATSKKMTWFLPLGATLFFWTRGQNTQLHDPTIRGYIGWIHKLEQKVALDLSFHENAQPNDAVDNLMIELEVVFFKFALADSVSGYTSLQKTLPRFLQLVAAESSLHTEHPNGNLVVSFTRTLTSLRYELRRFVVYDTVAALVLGVSPLVDYGYDEEPDRGFDWIRGVPVALAEVVSQVNSWRAGSGKALNSWQTLEMRVLTWKPPSNMCDEATAIENARIAVLESWRHVALIYIYMGMCGVSSHDLRVQAAVCQIVRLEKTIASSTIGVHMLTHYVIAGLAARLEKHRALFYEKLLSLKDTRVWLFHGPQFGQVLFDLWHGVGVGGAPVMWEDYVQSRRATIPI